MTTLNQLESNLQQYEENAVHYSNQNITESGISETINNGNMQRTKLEIELAKNNGMAEVDVLIWLTNEYGGIPGEIASIKMIYKYSPCYIVKDSEGNTEFIKTTYKEKTLKSYGLKKEKRVVPVQILEHVDSCFRSRYFLAQNDKPIYST